MSANTFLLRGKYPENDAPVDIIIKEGVVASIRKAGRTKPDLGGDAAIIAPALFDIQVNGAAGVDLQAPDLCVEHIQTLNAYLLRNGVTRWVPTLVTDAPEALAYRCRVLATAMSDPSLGRHIPGIHLEGPHIAEADGPRGAHPRAHVSSPDMALFNHLNRASSGNIIYVTLAPEWPGVTRFIRALCRKGVVVALGHHQAEARHITAAVKAGARLCTHLGNGMAPMIHRHTNALWPQLADDRLYASVIADLEHLPPAALQVFARAKGPERLVLVSDSVFLAGMKPGHYEMFGAAVEMKRTGRVCLAGTELLAGSSLMLLQGVWNLYQNTDFSLSQAFAAAARNPADLLNLSSPTWPPKPGHPADLLVCSTDSKTKNAARIRLDGVVSHGTLLVTTSSKSNSPAIHSEQV